MKKLVPILIAFIVVVNLNSHAQTTYQQVYSLFQAKCTGACHTSTTPSGGLDLTASPTMVYNSLVNAAPVNATALSKGYKLVTPGYPWRSYLLKKVNHGLDARNDLATGEGTLMPDTAAPLLKEEIELIRQWVIWGAKDTGVTYNSNLIHNYYSGQGTGELAAPPTPAEEGREGYQVRFGPIFLQPTGEFEFFQVYNPELQTPKEIVEMHSTIPTESHHWALRTITQPGATAMGAAPVDGANFNTQILVYTYTKFMAIWQFSGELNLPAGTAHYQDSAEALLLNLHLHNYSHDSIVAASGYLNFYTKPMSAGDIEMKTGLSSYGGTNPFLLQIPNTGVPFTLDNPCTSAGETRYFWNIQSHTHSRGKAFNMYMRNANGTKGTQIYDGNYNEDYTFNQGYYDYSHPAVRTFDPLMQVDMTKGLVFEATWLNSGPDTIPFGLTTNEEMFVTYFQYTNQLPAASAVNKINSDEMALNLYPNPAKGSFNLEYTLPNASTTVVEIYNSIGTKVKTIWNGIQQPGKHILPVGTSANNLPTGIYFVTFTADGIATTRKVITMD